MQYQNEKPILTMKELFKQRDEIEASIERTNNSKAKGGVVGPKMFENKIVQLEKQRDSIDKQINERLAFLVGELSKEAIDEIEVYDSQFSDLKNEIAQVTPF